MKLNGTYCSKGNLVECVSSHERPKSLAFWLHADPRPSDALYRWTHLQLSSLEAKDRPFEKSAASCWILFCPQVWCKRKSRKPDFCPKRRQPATSYVPANPLDTERGKSDWGRNWRCGFTVDIIGSSENGVLWGLFRARRISVTLLIFISWSEMHPIMKQR